MCFQCCSSTVVAKNAYYVKLHHNKCDVNVLLSFVTRSPLNEDVFAAQTKDNIPVSHEEIKDLQAKIYKLFLQVIILLNTKTCLLVSVLYQFEINPLLCFLRCAELLFFINPLCNSEDIKYIEVQYHFCQGVLVKMTAEKKK